MDREARRATVSGAAEGGTGQHRTAAACTEPEMLQGQGPQPPGYGPVLPVTSAAALD